MRVRDAAATHVLEAVIIAGIMLSAVAYVATFEGPPPNPSIVEDGIYGPKAEDFLKVMDDAPSQKCGTHSRLESLVVDGARGNHTDYNALIRGFFDPGIFTELLLDNLRAHMHLHGGNEMGLTRDITIFPRWGQPTSVQEAAATGLDRMSIQVPSEKNNELVRMKGDAVRTTIQTSDALGTRSYQAWSPTAILPFDGRDGIENITWNGTTGADLDLSHVEDSNDLESITGNLPIYVHLNVSGTLTSSKLTIPAHSGIQVQFPQGWTVDSTAFTNLPSLGFDVTTANRSTGVTLTLVANKALDVGQDLPIPAHPPASPARPFDVIRASAFNGSFGESSLVFQYNVTLSPSIPRQVFPTTPYPVKPGSWAFFGAAFTNGGTATTITQVDVEVPGGYDVWANGGKGAQLFDPTLSGSIDSTIDGRGGTWQVVDGQHARWVGSVEVPALSATWFGAYLPITSWANQTTSVEPPVGDGPSVTLGFPNGASFTSNAWGKSPGIVSLDVPNETVDLATQTPNGDGYRTSDSTFNVTVVGTSNQYGYQFANGTYSSDAADAGTMDSAAANSTFSVRDRLVPTGQFVTADADFSSVLGALSANGVATSNLTVDLYPPPSVGCEPTSSWSIDTKSLPRPSVRSLELMDLLGTGTPEAVAGLSDHRVYAIDASGLLVWTVDLGATPTALQLWDAGPSDRAVLALDDQGVLHKLSAATGAELWRATGVDVFRADAGLGRILTLGGGELALLDGAGSAVAQAASDCANAILLPNGNVFTCGPGDSSTLLDGALQTVASGGPSWIDAAPGPDGEILAVRTQPLDANEAVALDGSSLAVVSRVSLMANPPDVLATAWGDVDSDGVLDAAVVTDDSHVRIVDGATLAVSDYDALAGEMLDAKKLGVTRSLGCDADGRVAGTYLLENEGNCAVIDSAQPAPDGALVRASATGVAFALTQGGSTWFGLLDAHGGEKWRDLAEARTVTALASGAWGARSAVGVGFDDGAIEGDDAAGAPSIGHDVPSTFVTVSPGEATGTFTLYVPTPAGGFYGSDLLVASLSWVDSQQHAQSVRLVDWFEAVDDHGDIVTNPMYRVTLTAAPGDDHGKADG